jgi:hypothetical protein
MPGAIPFGSELLVNTATPGDQNQPAVTALADGRFVVAWTDDSDLLGDASGTAIVAQIFNADGSKSGADFLVNTTTTAGQLTPAVTALAGGGFAVAWTDTGTSGGDASVTGVRAQVFNADGSKSGAEFLVNTTTAGSQAEATIAALADGRFVVAWRDNSQSGGDTSLFAVRAQAFNADSSKSGTEFLVNTTPTNNQHEPSITALADGRFVVAWRDDSATGDDTLGSAVRAQMFNADGSQSGSEFVVNTVITNSQITPAITALAGGGFVVAWGDNSLSSGDNDAFSVRAQVFDAGGNKSGSQFVLATTIASAQQTPTVTALADGRFVAAWNDFSQTGGDTSSGAIRAQVFNADGSKSGAEFLVNTTTTGIQDEPTITALADGRFVVAWTDASESGGDTTDDAVRGQIFDPREKALILSGTALGDDYIGTGFGDFIDGRGGDDTIDGAGANDVLDGGAGDDIINGGTGADTIDGGIGADVLNGGADNDTYVLGDTTGDIISDTSGIDTATSTATRSLATFGTVENLTLLGTAAIDGTGNGLANTITGNAAVNTLTGGSGNDILDGGLGSDTLLGGTGNDTYIINSTGDALADTGGFDTVRSTVTKTLASGFENLTLISGNINGTGTSAANIIIGSSGINRLTGLNGNDTLDGGSGNDLLTGGLGRDVMAGGSGGDRFDFNSVSEIGKSSTRDLIKDFAHGSDDIDLATIDANGSAAGSAKFSFLAAKGATFTGTAGELRWFQQNLTGSASDKTIIEGDINGDRKAEFQIQLTGLKTLSATDFIL